MKARTGFTLIEVLVVLAIVSILAAVAYPNYAGYVTRTRRTEGQAALIDAMLQQERYRMQHNSYLAFSSDSTDEELAGLRWWSGARASTSMYELDGHACPGQPIARCIELRARPGTARVDASFRDPDCGALTLDSRGAQGAQGAGRCWP